jgi:hypothetical protein
MMRARRSRSAGHVFGKHRGTKPLYVSGLARDGPGPGAAGEPCSDRRAYLENGEPRPEVRSFDRGQHTGLGGPSGDRPAAKTSTRQGSGPFPTGPVQKTVPNRHIRALSRFKTDSAPRKEMTPDGKPGAICGPGDPRHTAALWENARQTCPSVCG